MQDELITIRGERFVIPVKIEQKRRVQGVVHGASSSGQTVFVEPLETIEQNNELVRLLDEEQAEIHRILLEMTRRIGESARNPFCRSTDVWPNWNCNLPKPASPKTTAACRSLCSSKLSGDRRLTRVETAAPGLSEPSELGSFFTTPATRCWSET